MSCVYVLMGVSGCGKTTVGQALADTFGVPFFDGDDFHPAENVAKMASGTPLTDDDRRPWLARLHDLMADHLDRGESAVVACSALKADYRAQLSDGQADRVQFVYLRGDFDLIWERMQARDGHFMKADMLRSQFDTLEAPSTDEALIVDIDADTDALVQQIITHVGRSS